MPSLEERQVSNLLFFLQDRWRPIAEAAEKHRHPELTEDYSSFALLETFFWLHLGVQANYFPRSESRRVTYEYFPIFLRAYEFILENRQAQKFSPLSQRILEVEFSGRKELFAEGRDLFEVSENLGPPFQTALILANEFAQDPAAEAVVDALAFKKARAWEVLARDFKEESKWFEIDNRKIGGWPQFMLSGVFNVVQYMEAFHEILMDSTTEVAMLKRIVREIQQWRLDFGDKSIFDRFLEILDATAVFLLRRLAEKAKFDYQDVQIVVKTIRRLMTEWGAPPLGIEVGV